MTSDLNPIPFYSTPYFNIFSKDSRYGEFFYLQYLDSVNAANVMIVQGDDMLFVEQDRPPVSKNTLEIVGGGVDFGETVEAGAIREVFEEVGIVIQEKDLIKLSCINPSPTILNETVTTYFVRLPEDFDRSTVKIQESEIELAHWVPISEVLDLVKQNKVDSGYVIIATLRARFEGLV
jgi:ADP-ribose pyrophosphatase